MTVRRPPPMGWNSWNSGVPLNEANVKGIVDAMVASGMRDAGYRYVNLDAGWAAPGRSGNGELQVDRTKFPGGMTTVAEYAHDRGMLLGLYSSPFNEICGQDRATASAGMERTDARTFAEWGVDFLKYDWCRVEAEHDEQVRVFSAMRDALRECGRPILYSINPNSSRRTTAGIDHSWSGVADMCRLTADLVPLWRAPELPLPPMLDHPMFIGVAEQFDIAASALERDDGVLADPDMLVVGTSWREFVEVLQRHAAGRSDAPAPSGELTGFMDCLLQERSELTLTEQRTQFTLWAVLAAPLLATNDVRAMSDDVKAILLNEPVIEVNQDPLGAPARRCSTDSRIVTRHLVDGSIAVAVHNPADVDSTVAVSLADVGLDGEHDVRDLWADSITTTTSGDIEPTVMAPHSCRLLRLSRR